MKREELNIEKLSEQFNQILSELTLDEVDQWIDSNDFIMNLTTIKITYNKTSK